MLQMCARLLRCRSAGVKWALVFTGIGAGAFLLETIEVGAAALLWGIGNSDWGCHTSTSSGSSGTLLPLRRHRLTKPAHRRTHRMLAGLVLRCDGAAPGHSHPHAHPARPAAPGQCKMQITLVAAALSPPVAPGLKRAQRRWHCCPCLLMPSPPSPTNPPQDISFFDAPENSSGALLSALASDAASVRGAVGDRVGHMLTLLSCVVGSYAIAFKSRCVAWRLA